MEQPLKDLQGVGVHLCTKLRLAETRSRRSLERGLLEPERFPRPTYT